MIEIYSEEWAIKEFEITLKMFPDDVSIEKSKITKLKKEGGRKMYIMLNNLANMLNVSAQFLQGILDRAEFAKFRNIGKLQKYEITDGFKDNLRQNIELKLKSKRTRNREHLQLLIDGGLDVLNRYIKSEREIKMAGNNQKQLRAYILKVDDGWNECGSIITWAQSASKAKIKALHNELCDVYEFVDIRAIRKKEWDKYAADECVPVEELLKSGWRCYCIECGRDDITQNDINEKRAFIIPGEKDDFVRGVIICKDCHGRHFNGY